MSKTLKSILILLLVIVILSSSSAQAHYLGGQWRRKSIVCYVSPNDEYFNHFRYAANAWDSTMYNIKFIEDHTKPAAVTGQSDWFGSTGWHGYGEPGPVSFYGEYTTGVVYINTYYTFTYEENAAKLQVLIQHELGHILGLAHHDMSIVSIMNNNLTTVYDVWGLTSPSQHDRNDVNNFYDDDWANSL